jgi:hypothetical protein
MHAPDLISDFYSAYLTTVRAMSIKDPLFLPEESPSPFLSPLSSLTVSPCHSPLLMDHSPEPSSLLLAPTTVQSLRNSEPKEISYRYSSPLSMVDHSTHNSFGPPSLLMEKTSISNTRQSESLEANTNHLYSLEETPPAILQKIKTLQLLPMHHRLMTPQQLKQKSKEIWQQSQKKSKSSPAPALPQRLQQNL